MKATELRLSHLMPDSPIIEKVDEEQTQNTSHQNFQDGGSPPVQFLRLEPVEQIPSESQEHGSPSLSPPGGPKGSVFRVKRRQISHSSKDLHIFQSIGQQQADLYQEPPPENAIDDSKEEPLLSEGSLDNIEHGQQRILKRARETRIKHSISTQMTMTLAKSKVKKAERSSLGDIQNLRIPAFKEGDGVSSNADLSPLSNMHRRKQQQQQQGRKKDFIVERDEEIHEEINVSLASNWQSSHSSSYISHFEFDDDMTPATPHIPKLPDRSPISSTPPSGNQTNQKTNRAGVEISKFMRAKSLRVQQQEYWSNQFVISTSNFYYQAWRLILIISYFSSANEYVMFAAYSEQYKSKELEDFYLMDNLYTILFVIDMVLHCFVEHHYTTSSEVERNVSKLTMIYLKKYFIADFIVVMPFSKIVKSLVSNAVYRMLYIIKVLRLQKAFWILNQKTFTRQLKHFQNQRIRTLIQRYRKKQLSNLQDATKLSQIMFLSKIFKAIQLIIIIMCISYFSGMTWYVVADLTLNRSIENGTENFITYFDIDRTKYGHTSLTVLYYLFTSLTTVGLGDYHPRSNIERILGAFLLLFGVMITTFIMDNLNNMIKQIQNFSSPYEETSQLYLFLGTLKRFNSNTPLPVKVYERIDEFFHFRWSRHKNLAIQTKDEEWFFYVLPTRVQRVIQIDFLYSQFLEKYKNLFKSTNAVQKLHTLKTKLSTKLSLCIKEDSELSGDPLDWNSDKYQEFVIRILNYLEPKLINRKVIQKQNALVDEIVFIMEGDFEIGYNHEFYLIQQGVMKMGSIMTGKGASSAHNPLVPAQAADGEMEHQKKRTSRQLHFPFSYKPGQCVGLFEMCFEQRSQFIYRAKDMHEDHNRNYKYGKKHECFFIRKKNWKLIMRDPSGYFRTLIEHFKNKVLLNYLDKFYMPVKEYQERMLRHEKNKNNPERKLMNIMMILGGGNKKKSQLSKGKSSLMKMEDDNVTSEHDFSEEESLMFRRELNREELINLMMRSKLTKNEHKQLRNVNLIKPFIREKRIDEIIPLVDEKIEVQNEAVSDLVQRLEQALELAQLQKGIIDKLEKENLDLKKALKFMRMSMENDFKKEKQSQGRKNDIYSSNDSIDVPAPVNDTTDDLKSPDVLSEKRNQGRCSSSVDGQSPKNELTLVLSPAEEQRGSFSERAKEFKKNQEMEDVESDSPTPNQTRKPPALESPTVIISHDVDGKSAHENMVDTQDQWNHRMSSFQAKQSLDSNFTSTPVSLNVKKERMAVRPRAGSDQKINQVYQQPQAASIKFSINDDMSVHRSFIVHQSSKRDGEEKKDELSEHFNSVQHDPSIMRKEVEEEHHQDQLEVSKFAYNNIDIVEEVESQQYEVSESKKKLLATPFSVAAERVSNDTKAAAAEELTTYQQIGFDVNSPAAASLAESGVPMNPSWGQVKVQDSQMAKLDIFPEIPQPKERKTANVVKGEHLHDLPAKPRIMASQRVDNLSIQQEQEEEKKSDFGSSKRSKSHDLVAENSVFSVECLAVTSTPSPKQRRKRKSRLQLTEAVDFRPSPSDHNEGTEEKKEHPSSPIDITRKKRKSREPQKVLGRRKLVEQVRVVSIVNRVVRKFRGVNNGKSGDESTIVEDIVYMDEAELSLNGLEETIEEDIQMEGSHSSHSGRR